MIKQYLRIATDHTGIVISVALDRNVRASRVLSHGRAGGTRAVTVANAITRNDTTDVALLEFDWRSDWLGKSQRWEGCHEGEDWNERKLHG